MDNGKGTVQGETLSLPHSISDDFLGLPVKHFLLSVLHLPELYEDREIQQRNLAEDYQKALRMIKNGVSESLSYSLWEGFNNPDMDETEAFSAFLQESFGSSLSLAIHLHFRSRCQCRRTLNHDIIKLPQNLMGDQVKMSELFDKWLKSGFQCHMSGVYHEVQRTFATPPRFWIFSISPGTVQFDSFDLKEPFHNGPQITYKHVATVCGDRSGGRWIEVLNMLPDFKNSWISYKSNGVQWTEPSNVVTFDKYCIAIYLGDHHREPSPLPKSIGCELGTCGHLLPKERVLLRKRQFGKTSRDDAENDRRCQEAKCSIEVEFKPDDNVQTSPQLPH